MANILSLQSHVAYGYVGNRAAVFPLQRLGHEVVAINTVQFSNHTGYGSWTGDIMTVEHIDKIFTGLDQQGMLRHIDGILTGYLGDSVLGEVLLNWLQKLRVVNPQLIYCCDPVIGDIGRGVFVKSGVPEFFRDQALSHATILTPNQFELTHLTGIEISTLADAKEACRILHNRGAKQILVTSLTRDDADSSQIEMLLSTKDEAYLVATPRLEMPIAPNGSGDMTAAIYLAKYLETRDLKQSLEHTAAALFATFDQTLKLARRELAIIQSQNELVQPKKWFKAQQVI
ncbi:MAG: pyridoxal kinase PdxY [Neisseriaceae bacterium]|nr:MAG: pyridoxal kinase PdxY [Neisseriaceae bacterium]